MWIWDALEWAGNRCEDVSRFTLNTVSFGNGWGDKLYDGIMAPAADAVVGGMANRAYDAAYQQALASGAGKFQAEIAANQAMGAKMDAVINPGTLGETADFLGAGLATSGKTLSTVGSNIKDALSPDVLASLTPLLVGAGILGGIYLLTEMFSGSPTPQPTSRKRRTARVTP